MLTLNRLSVLMFAIVALAVVNYPTSAQQDGTSLGDQISADTLSQIYTSDAIIVYASEPYGLGDFSAFNLRTSQRETFHVGIETVGMQANGIQDRITTHDIDLVSDGNYLYLIQGPPLVLKNPPRQTTLFRVDLLTQEREVIYTNQEVFRFDLSPDQHLAAVSSYQGDFGRSSQQVCLLDMQTFVCEPLILDATYRFGTWVDNETFVLFGGGGYLAWVVNANDLSTTLIANLENWYINSLTHIPNTRKILLGANLRTEAWEVSHFLVYDLDTTQLTEITYRPPANNSQKLQDYGQVYALQFSPNAQYLLYSGGNYRKALIDFTTGELITELTGSIAYWLPNGEGIISTHRVNDDLLQISKFDLATRQTEILLETPDSLGIIVP